ncbi:vanillin dehydrogenase, partial [Pseudoroseomonas cervicalis ATCC 49957]
MLDVPLLIGGEGREAQAGGVFERRNPVGGHVASRAAAASAEDAR